MLSSGDGNLLMGSNQEAIALELSFKESACEGCCGGQGSREEKIWSRKIIQKNTVVDQTKDGNGWK